MTTTRKKSRLTRSQRREVYRVYKIYRNDGSCETGKWVYQPHDYDSTFELWSEGYRTRREAVEAAYADLQTIEFNPEFDCGNDEE